MSVPVHEHLRRCVCVSLTLSIFNLCVCLFPPFIPYPILSPPSFLSFVLYSLPFFEPGPHYVVQIIAQQEKDFNTDLSSVIKGEVLGKRECTPKH